MRVDTTQNEKKVEKKHGLMAAAEAVNQKDSVEDSPIADSIVDFNEESTEESLVSPAKSRKIKPKRNPKVSISGLLTRLILILILLVILMFGGIYAYSKIFAPPKAEGKSIVVQDQLMFCQEFVSLKYHYSDIVSVKKVAKIGPSKSYSIIKYTGIVRVGIEDLTEADYEVVEFEQVLEKGTGKIRKIIIKLPETKVLGNEIVSQEVFDEQHSIFVPITLEEVFTEIEKSREEALEEILSDGLLEEAAASARRFVRQYFLNAGFDEVEVY